MSEKDERTMAAVAYVLGFITGLLVYVMYKEKKNKFVLFHAMQSTISSVIATVVMLVIAVPIILISLFIPGLGCILDLIILIPIAILGLAFMVFMAYKAYNGEKVMLPAIGEMAEKYAG